MKVLRKLRMAMAISSLMLLVGACGKDTVGVDGYYRGSNYGSCDPNATGENVYDGTITSYYSGSYGYQTQGSVKLTVLPSGGMVSGQFTASAVLDINSTQFCCTSQGISGVLGMPEAASEKATVSGLTLVCNSMSGGTSYFNNGYQAITLKVGVPVQAISYETGKASLRTDQRLKGFIEISSGSQIVNPMPNATIYFVE
jgi:hypothetical protein